MFYYVIRGRFILFVICFVEREKKIFSFYKQLTKIKHEKLPICLRTLYFKTSAYWSIHLNICFYIVLYAVFSPFIFIHLHLNMQLCVTPSVLKSVDYLTRPSPDPMWIVNVHPKNLFENLPEIRKRKKKSENKLKKGCLVRLVCLRRRWRRQQIFS